MTVVPGETPVLTVADARAWSEWLRNHEEALEEAICHGWVDGRLTKGDERAAQVVKPERALRRTRDIGLA